MSNHRAAIAQQPAALAALRELLEAIESGDSLRGADAMSHAEDVLRGAAIAQPAEPHDSTGAMVSAWFGTPAPQAVERVFGPAAQADAQPVAWLRDQRDDYEGPEVFDPLVILGARPPQPGIHGATYSPLFAAAPPARQPQPLTEAQILECVRSVGLPPPMGLTRDRGPYEVTEPTFYLCLLVRTIEKVHGIGREGEKP